MLHSFSFWIAILTLSGFVALFGGTRRGVVEGALVVASLAVLAAVFKLPAWTILLLLIIVTWVVFSLRWKCHAWIVAGPVAGSWVLAKICSVWPESHLGHLLFIGFSFLVVKAWTLARDVEAGKLEKVDSITTAAYLLFFPTYTAGPMFYYSEFRQTLDNPSGLDLSSFVDAVFRIVLGMTKTIVIAPLLMPISLIVVPQSDTMTAVGLLGASVVYSVVIYCDFSGYSDIAIGAARLMGVEVPENFKQPYLARNLREFWQKWHITFSRVLTSYVFVPCARYISLRWTDRRAPLLVASYLITFSFCGFWHGSTWNFLIWGVYHGVGLAVYDLYKPRATRRRLKQKENSEVSSVVGRIVSTALTFVYVSIGWIPFALPTEELIAVLGKIVGS